MCDVLAERIECLEESHERSLWTASVDPCIFPLIFSRVQVQYIGPHDYTTEGTVPQLPGNVGLKFIHARSGLLKHIVVVDIGEVNEQGGTGATVLLLRFLSNN